jgi:hypothetical protein
MSRPPALRVQVLDPTLTTVETTLDSTAHKLKAVSEMNGLGGVSVDLANSDAQLATLIDGRVLRAQVLTDFDAATYTTVAQGVYKRNNAIRQARKPTDKTTTATAMGMLWELTQTSLEGPGPSPFDDKVRLDWSWPGLDRTSWTAAVQRSVVGDTTALPPAGLAGLPRNFPNPLAYWIAPTAASGDDPVGDWYAHFQHTSSADETWVIYVSADDGFELALDGVVGGFRAMDDIGDAAAYSWYWKVRVPAGTHSIAAHVRNLARDTENNCSMLAVAVARTVITEDGYDEEWIFTTSSSGWVCLATTGTAPGVTPGEALDLLTPSGWSKSFTDTQDSGGTNWERTPIILDAYEDYWTLAKRLCDAGLCDVAADEEQRIVHAWATRGQDRPSAIFADGVNIERAEHGSDSSEQATGIWARDLYGWVLVGSDSGATPKFELGDIADRSETIRLATAKLAELSDPLDTITLNVVATSNATTPGVGFDVGDTIRAPGADGAESTWRVMQWTLGVGRDGRLEARIQLNSLMRDRVERLERASKRTTSGALGGRSVSAAPVSPFQQRAGRLDEITWVWSWSGPASELDSSRLVGPPVRFDRPYRLQVAEALVNSATSGATSIAVKVNGSTVATTLLAAGTTYERESFLVVVGPGDLAVVEMSDATRGDHDSGSVTLVGSPMP